MKKKIRKWLYGKCPGFKGSFPYYNTKVYFPENSHIFHKACEQGTYEHDIVKLILSLIKSDTYFFDVGANIGLIAIPILFNRPTCKCISFEPSPNSLPFLMKTAKESELAKRWEIVGNAVGAARGECDFNLSNSAYSAFEGIKSTGRVPVEKVVKIPVTTIDYEWHVRNRPEISVIKIDVEGAEIDVLKGACECIASQKPFIITEWNVENFKAYGNAPADLIKVAEEIGYAIYSIPQIVKISDATDMKVQMIFSENCLLCPN